MPRRRVLLVLACALCAAVPARTGASPAGAEPSGSGMPASGGSGEGARVSGNRFDARLSLDLAYPFSKSEGGFGYRGGLVAGWNPAFLGWDGRLAAGGLLWGAPNGSASFHARTVKFASAMDEAWLRRPFPAGAWAAAFQAGLFRWRSHPDAALAGEYLARWGAYPLDVVRPDLGYEPPDSLTTRLFGLRLALAAPARTFGQEFLAVLDKRPETIFLTVIASTTFSPLPGLEAGVGAAFHEALDSRDDYAYDYPAHRTYGQADTGAGTDGTQMRHAVLEFRTLACSARLSVDLATWIAGASRPDRGGRLYAEAAVLGWKDYPYYYAERMRRVQFCAGLDLPTFGLLHAFRLQAERRSYPLADNPRLFSSASAAVLPESWWIGRAHLARTLLPGLEAHALALWDLGPQVPDPYFLFAPTEGMDGRPRHGAAGWSWEAKLTARL